MNQELVVAEKDRNRLLYNDSKGNIEEKNWRIIELENELKIIRERMRSDSVKKNHNEPSSQLERSCTTRSYDQVVRRQVSRLHMK